MARGRRPRAAVRPRAPHHRRSAPGDGRRRHRAGAAAPTDRSGHQPVHRGDGVGGGEPDLAVAARDLGRRGAVHQHREPAVRRPGRTRRRPGSGRRSRPPAARPPGAPARCRRRPGGDLRRPARAVRSTPGAGIGADQQQVTGPGGQAGAGQRSHHGGRIHPRRPLKCQSSQGTRLGPPGKRFATGNRRLPIPVSPAATARPPAGPRVGRAGRVRDVACADQPGVADLRRRPASAPAGSTLEDVALAS